MRLGRALTAMVVALVMTVGCGGGKKLVVSPDAAVAKDVNGPGATDATPGRDDVAQAGGRETGGADTEETAAADAANDPAVPGPETGRDSAETVGRDSVESRPASEVASAGETAASKETGDTGDAAGASETGDAKETGATAEVGAGEAGSKPDTGAPEVCTSYCNVDFPCSADRVPACARGNPKAIVNYVTVGCEEICGTPCCSGAQCQGRSQDCPAGTACAYPSPPTTALGAKAECFDEARTCGGADNKPCPSGQYCEHMETLCSGSNCPSSTSACSEVLAGSLGICAPLPASSTCDTTDPLCGCDGVTYQNECARKVANAARAHRGACP